MGDRKTSVAVSDASLSQQTPMWHSLRAYPSFRVLFNGTLGTNTAFWMWNIAAGWLALQMTDSPFFVGLTGFLGGIPTLIFALPGGVVIDRFDRRSVLLAAQGLVMLTALVVSALLILDLMKPWHLLVGAFVNGTAMSFVFPTRNALVANLVPKHDLANAVALNAAGQNSTRVIGPALAGPLIAALGVSGTFIACTLSQVIAMLITLRLPSAPPSPSAARRSLWGSLVEGLAVIWRSEYLTGLIILAAVPTMLVLPYSNLLPVFAEHELKIGASGLGLLMSLNGLGAVLGALAVAGWRKLTNMRGVMIWSSMGFAVVVLLFAYTTVTLLAGVLMFLAGAVSAIYMAVNNTKIQLSVDDSVRGRVLGVYLLTWGLLPVGTLPAGALADRHGAPAAVAGMSILALVLIVLTVLRFRALYREDVAPVEVGASR